MSTERLVHGFYFLGSIAMGHKVVLTYKNIFFWPKKQKSKKTQVQKNTSPKTTQVQKTQVHKDTSPQKQKSIKTQGQKNTSPNKHKSGREL